MAGWTELEVPKESEREEFICRGQSCARKYDGDDCHRLYCC